MGRFLVSVALSLIAAAPAIAGGTRLVVVDHRPSTGKVKVTWGVPSTVVPVSKGIGNDRAAIAATLHLRGGGQQGSLVAPVGAGWIDATSLRARYRDKAVGAPVRSVVIREGKAIRFQGANPGDTLLDTLAGTTAISVAFRVDNAGDTIDHCVTYASCERRTLGDGGFQLDCRDGVADPTCAARPAVCGNGVREVGEACDGGAYCTPACQLPSLSPGCCQAAASCRAADGFSLNFYLLQFCGGIGGDTPVPGGVCSAGTCQGMSIAPVPVCCQLTGSCYDGTADSTGALWSFRNYCTGANLGTVTPGAVCGTGGACEPG